MYQAEVFIKMAVKQFRLHPLRNNTGEYARLYMHMNNTYQYSVTMHTFVGITLLA